jgi:hypothetical protein
MIKTQVSASVASRNGSSPHSTIVPSTANSGSSDIANVMAMNQTKTRRGNDRFGHSVSRRAGACPSAKEKAPVFAGAPVLRSSHCMGIEVSP